MNPITHNLSRKDVCIYVEASAKLTQKYAHNKLYFFNINGVGVRYTEAPNFEKVFENLKMTKTIM